MADSSDAARGRTAATALAVTLSIQVFVALAATATAVLAPEIARDLGVPAKLVGVFVGLVYLGSMTASLASGHFIERHGAIRVSQVCVLICAAGSCMIAFTQAGWLPLVVLAALVIGIGYGPITPASSQVLARTAPPSRMALTFSIKQTGVPGGAALAGAVLPVLAVGLGWRTALLAVAALGVAVAALGETMRSKLDAAPARESRPFSLAGMITPLRTVFRHPVLLELSITGFVYAAMQVCLTSFLVVYLTEALGFALVAAGLALTAANVGGIIGRVGWGAVADQWIAPRRMLGLLGLAAAACAYAAASFEGSWPRPVLLAVCALYGATAIGWNGVQLAEIARHAPAGQAGAITGASGFITFAGVMFGPPAFALLATLTGSYRIGFAVFGTVCLACGAALLMRPPANPAPA